MIKQREMNVQSPGGGRGGTVEELKEPEGLMRSEEG